MPIPVIVPGTLQVDGSLKLDYVPNLPPGPVVVTLQSASSAATNGNHHATQPVPDVSEEFYAELGRLPESEETFEAQRAIFLDWRSDTRFKTYWVILDQALSRSFEHVRKWATAISALPDFEGYDFDAYKKQREFDAQHAGDHLL